jgi:chromosome segregation ATPase
VSHPVIDRLRSRTRGRGQHRAIDEVPRLRAELDQERARSADLRRQLDTATTGWDAANAKVSQLRDELARAVEATRQNQTAVSSLTRDPSVTETQPIRVITLPEADRWGYLK